MRFNFWLQDAERYAKNFRVPILNCSLPDSAVYSDLSVDNPVFEIFSIEQQPGDEFRVKKALTLVNNLVGQVKARFKTAVSMGSALSSSDQMHIVYEIIDDKISVEGQTGIRYLYEGLARTEPKRDCDTGVLLFLIIGYELRWPLSGMYCSSLIMNKSDHAFIKWKDSGTEFFFETTNGNLFENVSDDEQYAEWPIIRELSATQFMSKVYQTAAAGCKNRDTALAYNNKAIALDPQGPIPYYNRAIIYDERHQYDEAFEDCATFFTLYPVEQMYHKLYYRLLLNRSIYYSNNNDFAAALADVDVLLGADPRNPEYVAQQNYIIYRRAVEYSNTDCYTEALADLDILLKSEPHNKEYLKVYENTLYNRAIDNGKAARYAEALPDLKLLTTLYPHNENYLKLYAAVDLLSKKSP
jgi:hypothetical protein